jgi:2-dehydropantoate 2-reductase
VDKMVVFGAGGVGGYIAAMLARSGHWVALITRGQQLRAIKRTGLRIESSNGTFEARPSIVSDKPEEIGAVDGVILAVKTWQVADAALSLRPMLGPGTRVLALQNGVEVFQELETILGTGYALMGVCWVLSHAVEPGRIVHIGLDPALVVGEREGGCLSPNAAMLAEALAKSGFQVHTSADIERSVWEKWVFVSAVSGVGAVARGTFGEIRLWPATRELTRALMNEVAAVATSRGIKLSEDVVDRNMALVDAMPANGTASMQRDILAGRPSELETLVGAIIRFGVCGGIPTPVARFIYGCLSLQESIVRASRVGSPTSDRLLQKTLNYNRG